MEAGREQHLVRVNVPDARQESLIQQQAFQPPVPLREPPGKLLELELQGFGPERSQFGTGFGPGRPEAADEPEFTDVPEPQLSPFSKEGDRKMGMPVPRDAARFPDEPAGHLEMKDEGAVARARDDQHLPATMDAENDGVAERPEVRGAAVPDELGPIKTDAPDDVADDRPAQAGRDRLDFGKFGHASILHFRPFLLRWRSFMTMKSVLALVVGWFIPGLGHIIQKKYARGFVFLASILAMTGLGLMMGGRIYPFQTENPLTILAFFADIGNGAVYLLSRVLPVGVGELKRMTFEFGTAYIAGAGLLNYLIALDAFDIALGKKS